MDVYGTAKDAKITEKQAYTEVWRDTKTDIPTFPTMKTLGGKDQ
ncbi:hypothetical protein IMSAGC017_00719 [Thomasclavelia cocleata]|uniref:Uncharacterized protein n=1 Tax=Thomasclavelia cocleata TaxID=69824 RepID=A0A829ZCH9_9FIRM|nr:hypothetical protein [Thomasclavelia cocleata]GFI40684.1 hypothetical protein IMSAGC017_00719 [Thomasclavelia cocleata]